jgi:hypothetical protein
MRATRESLLKIAQETIDTRARNDRHLVAAYLSGSLLEDNHLLGGTADVDLFIVHTETPPAAREIVRLSDEVHLDIAHLDQKEFRQARMLRVDPWLGPTLNDCRVLYDPQHFMDFTVASVRGQFNRADYVYERASQPAAKARRIWLGLQGSAPQAGPRADPEVLLEYLRAVGHAANAITELSGPPLTERRMLVHFADRAGEVGKPGLYPGLLGLLGAPRLSPGSLAAWMDAWGTAMQALPPERTPARLHPDRRPYYIGGIETLLASPNPENALWPLLRTWTLAIACLPEGPASTTVFESWQTALTQLELAGAGFSERLSALDAYLDLVDEVLDEWARQNGV